MTDYPEQIECAWLARDALGQLAVFITAGDGPIPTLALGASSFSVDELEGELLELPVSTRARLVAGVGDLSSYAALAERGLFVFDWTDIHRIHREAIGAYELVASPEKSRMAAVLSPGLVAAALVAFNLDFGGTRILDPRPLVQCVVSQRGM